MTTTVEGLDVFRVTLARAVAELEDLSAVHEDAATGLAVAGAGAAPRRTGELAGSFGLAQLSADGVAVAVSAPHAPHVQFGTRFMAARPFMPDDPATDVTPLYLDHLADVVGQIKGM